MTEFSKGESKDFEEIVDFINYVFSYSHEPHDFRTLLPKIYKEGCNTATHHYLAKEEGRIKASVGSFPFDLNILNETLKVSGIGNVAVHPYSRGQGYMKKLMAAALDDMHNQGVELSFLVGQRQRYEYFGYTPCGSQMNFQITSDNVRHYCGNNFSAKVEFLLVGEENEEFIKNAFELYNRKNPKVLRDEKKFLDIAHSWQSSVYEILVNETFAGYVTVSKNMKSIREIVLLHEEQLLEVIVSYINAHKLSEVKISLPIYEQNRIQILLAICEGSSLTNNLNFNVLNYERVIDAFLKLKANYLSLKNGDLSIRIKEYGTICISVQDNKVNVVKSEENGEIELDHLKAMQFLFSPFKPMENLHKKCDLINSWLPIPLYINKLDSV